MSATVNYVHVVDEDLEWLKATVKQYDWYIAGVKREPKPNRRALAILTAQRDRYARLLKRLEPVVTITTYP